MTASKRIAGISAAGIFGLTLTACGGGGGGAGSPEGAVEDFLDAVANGDGETACNVVYDPSEGTFDEWDSDYQNECIEAFDDIPGQMAEAGMPEEMAEEVLEVLESAEVSLVEEGDDTAVVEMEISFMGMTESEEIDVLNVDGGWYVDFDDAEGAGLM